MKPNQKVALLIFYHLLSIGAIIYLFTGHDFATGPCSPSIGLLIFILFGFILCVLLFIGIAKFLISMANQNKSKPNKYMLFINLLMCAIWIMIFYRLSN